MPTPAGPTQVIAVNGSLMPGESARTAISTIWWIANSISWEVVRWLPRMKTAFTFASSGSVTRSPGPSRHQRAAHDDVLSRPPLHPKQHLLLRRQRHQFIRVDELEVPIFSRRDGTGLAAELVGQPGAAPGVGGPRFCAAHLLRERAIDPLDQFGADPRDHLVGLDGNGNVISTPRLASADSTPIVIDR